jgi:hypothetical protein
LKELASAEFSSEVFQALSAFRLIDGSLLFVYICKYEIINKQPATGKNNAAISMEEKK